MTALQGALSQDLESKKGMDFQCMLANVHVMQPVRVATPADPHGEFKKLCKFVIGEKLLERCR